MSSNDFDFGQDPFSLKPELKYFYQSSIGESFYRQLTKQIRKGQGVLLVTGEAGIGKSLLISEICRQLASQVRFLRLNTENKSFLEIINQLFKELGLKAEINDSASCIGTLRDYLSKPAQEGTRIALIFDDAHQLQDDVLTNLLSLSVLPTENSGSLQIMLSGLPELDTRVFQLELPDAIKQFKIFCCRLEKLSPSAVRGFIRHRLESVGYDKYNLFTPDAISRIAAYSNGIPRLLIKLCGSALSKACLDGKRTVTAEIVDRVAKDYLLKPVSAANQKQYTGIDCGGLWGAINRVFPSDFAAPLLWGTGLAAVMVVGGLVYQLSGVSAWKSPNSLEVEVPKAPEPELAVVQTNPDAAAPSVDGEMAQPVADMASLSNTKSGQSQIQQPVTTSPPPARGSGPTLAVALQQPPPSEPAADPANAAQPGDNARQLISALDDPQQPADLEKLYQQAARLGKDGQPTDAYLLYFYAAKRGHGEAAFKLAQLADPATFKAGVGLSDTPSLTQANKWYQQALVAGHGQARQALTRLHTQVAQRAAQGDEPAQRLMLQLDAH